MRSGGLHAPAISVATVRMLPISAWADDITPSRQDLHRNRN
jgi:hypothetical protein